MSYFTAATTAKMYALSFETFHETRALRGIFCEFCALRIFGRRRRKKRAVGFHGLGDTFMFPCSWLRRHKTYPFRCIRGL